MANASEISGRIFILRVTVRESDPPIWRRVAVPEEMTLAGLHRTIVGAMGWDGDHLHEFAIGDQRYSEPALCEPEEDIGYRNENRIPLGEVLTRPRMKFQYLYDFGDDWRHDIVVEAIQPAEAGVTYPRCLEGEGACPLEDCGGIWRYQSILSIMRNPRHPEHEDVMNWYGVIDPLAFNCAEANKNLRARFRRRP